MAPERWDFAADAGSYYISLFASAIDSQAYEAEKQTLIDQLRQERRAKRQSGMSARGNEGAERRVECPFREGEASSLDTQPTSALKSISTHRYCDTPAFGQYGIQVKQVGDGETVVPVPAALWLMGSGLIGLAAVGRRRKH